MKFNEDSRLKIFAIVYLKKLGYKFLPKANALKNKDAMLATKHDNDTKFARIYNPLKKTT